MKDVAWRRYASGKCLATFDPKISEWGNPISVTRNCLAINRMTCTLGSETSQYQEEQKLISIPPVAASEKGEAQTSFRKEIGVVRQRRSLLGKLQKVFLNETAGKRCHRR